MSELGSLLKNFENYELLIERDYLLDNFFHASIWIKDNPKIIGSGSAETDFWALRKALSELEERTRFVYLASTNPQIVNTNGFAAHSVLEFAQQNALNELIERDMFISSWLVKKSPLWIKDNLEARPIWLFIEEYISLFAKSFYELKVGIIGKSNGIWVTTAALKPLLNNDFGIVITTGAHEKLETSLKRVVEDQLRMVTILEARKLKSGRIYNLISDDYVLKPESHLEYYLNPENAKKIEWYTHNSDEAIVANDIDFEFDELKMGFIDPSLFVARCRSEEAQLYFNGKTNLEFINIQRLEQFSETKDYNYQFHPLG